MTIARAARGLGVAAFAAAASLGAGLPARAQMTASSQRVVGGAMEFSFAFRDAAGAARTLAFRLPVAEVDAAMALFRDYSIPHLYLEIENAVLAEARRAGVTLRVTRVGQGMSIRFAPETQPGAAAFQARLDDIVDGARNRWLARHTRRADGPAIHMDYRAATARYTAAVRPVALALAAQLAGADDRARIALALAFVQSIPYDDLVDPRAAGGIEFAPPPAMFRIAKGDCDSKTVALAAILRTLAPGRRVAFLTLPQHVALLVDLPPAPGDAIVRHAGRDWVALEPSGPAVVPPGHVAPTTAWYFDRPAEMVVHEAGG
ncbi:MAG: hypothetical protein IPK81_21260 [Rhodospirillales bacterium]|nr:MAG: hypothetical protein IPK81_21260 [Rhodospirillales bacterium]